MHFLQLSQQLQKWPLWQQILLLLTILVVGHFWLGKLLGGIQLNAGWANRPLVKLLRLALVAGAVSYLSTAFCVGSSAAGIPYEWGFYGRILFVGQTLFLTQLLTRTLG